jgi:ketosteroid isomerase-like protein
MTSTSSAADVDAIRQMYPAFVAAKLDRDVQRELSFVTDDAVYSPPGIPDVAGKAALRAWWTSREAADSLEVFELDPGEIIVAGDLAYSRGTSMSRFRNRRTGQISNQIVRHLDILRRQPDGHWLISRHIRNSSKAAPE